MAIAFRDGMDSYTTTADVTASGKWVQVASGWTYNATAGRNGGGGLVFTSSSHFIATKSGILAATECCYAFWLKISAPPAATTSILVPIDVNGNAPASGTGLLQVVLTSGVLRQVASPASTTFTGTTGVCDNQWHWVEVDIECALGNGATLICYVDGVQQWSTGVSNVQALTIDHLQINGLASVTMTLDDFMVWNNTAGGPVFSSLPLGPRQITTLRPNADVTQTFSRSTGSSNYSLVDEQTLDTSDYVESGTSGDQDLYDFENFSVSPAGITDVGWNGTLVNPNPGTINFQSSLKSGGNTSLGTSTITPSAYQNKQVSYGTDPATSAAWLASAVNSVQAGIKVV